MWYNTGPELSYRLTDAQKSSLEDTIQAAAELAVHTGLDQGVRMPQRLPVNNMNKTLMPAS